MSRRLGRRPLFFGFTALVCVALVPACPADVRWVAWLMAALAAFWAILLGAEDLLTTTAPEEPPRAPPEPESPFAPPPPPGGVDRS